MSVKRVALIGPGRSADKSYYENAEYLFRYSGENTGNFAFIEAIYSHLAPHVQVFPWFAPVEVVRGSADIVVMACANQLGPHTNMEPMAAWLESLELPIVSIGLGAQAAAGSTTVELQEGTLRWLKVMADRAPSSHPNISVRGAFTKSVIDDLGLGDKVAVCGCPSLFLNPKPDLAQRIQSNFDKPWQRIAVPAGLYKWKSLAQAERNLVRLVTETAGVYISQSQLEMLRLAREEFEAIGPETLEEIRAYTAPEMSMDAFQRWCRRYAVAYVDAVSWMDAMKKFDFVVGARFHGIMLAVQAGVPGGVVAHDSRTVELCSTMAIPHRMANELPDEFGLEDLRQLFAFDAVAFDSARRNLGATYAAVLDNAGITHRIGKA